MKNDFFLVTLVLVIVFLCSLGAINLLTALTSLGVNYSGGIGLGVSIFLILGFFELTQR